MSDHPSSAVGGDITDWMPSAGDERPAAKPVSAPTPSEPPATEQIDLQDSILYAWQLHDPERGWNIIGIVTPTGASLPLVTTSFDVAWNAFDIAQDHATRYNTRCRLAAFRFENLMAVVLPNDTAET